MQLWHINMPDHILSMHSLYKKLWVLFGANRVWAASRLQMLVFDDNMPSWLFSTYLLLCRACLHRIDLACKPIVNSHPDCRNDVL